MVPPHEVVGKCLASFPFLNKDILGLASDLHDCLFNMKSNGINIIHCPDQFFGKDVGQLDRTDLEKFSKTLETSIWKTFFSQKAPMGKDRDPYFLLAGMQLNPEQCKQTFTQAAIDKLEDFCLESEGDFATWSQIPFKI